MELFKTNAWSWEECVVAHHLVDTKLRVPIDTDQIETNFGSTDESKLNAFCQVLRECSDVGVLEHKLIHHVLSVFSETCDKQIWEEFYQPILSRSISINHTQWTYNGIAKANGFDDLMFKPFEPSPIVRTQSIPNTECVFMPVYDLDFDRKLIIVENRNDAVTTTILTPEFIDTGEDCRWTGPVSEGSTISTVLDCICYKDKIFVHDVFVKNSLHASSIARAKFARGIVSNVESKDYRIYSMESCCEKPENIQKVIKTLNEFGKPVTNLLVRLGGSEYPSGSYLISKG